MPSSFQSSLSLMPSFVLALNRLSPASAGRARCASRLSGNHQTRLFSRFFLSLFFVSQRTFREPPCPSSNDSVNIRSCFGATQVLVRLRPAWAVGGLRIPGACFPRTHVRAHERKAQRLVRDKGGKKLT